MRNLLAVFVIATITACGGGGSDSSSSPGAPGGSTPPPTNYPPQGEVLSSQCDGYTATLEIADGNGGSTSKVEEQSETCGWEDPVYEVFVVKDTGDRFDRVEFQVSAFHFGEPIDYEYDIEYGTVIKTDTGIQIASDGRLGTHVGVIAGQEFQYTFNPEPVCEGTRTQQNNSYYVVVDCQGYLQGSSSPFYIYYGEPDEDQTIATWEVINVFYDPACTEEPCVAEDFQQVTSQTYIDQANELFRRWGVFVELKLVGTFAHAKPAGTLYHDHIASGVMPNTDIIGINTSAGPGLCGYAGMAYKFRDRIRENAYLSFVNGCGLHTWLHEMGHAVGMCHGPYNDGNPCIGVTFREFAHGGYGVCGHRYDIMAYGGSVNNSSFTSPYSDCKDHYPNAEDYYGQPSGDTTHSATGYAINRVRFDVSLVHDEWEHPDATDNPEYSILQQSRMSLPDEVIIYDPK